MTAEKEAEKLIKTRAASCVIFSDNAVIEAAKGRGIGPVVSFYEWGLLSGAGVADKIVGKAAAMIMTLGGAVFCYAEIISADALAWLDAHGVRVRYGTLTDRIVNRRGDGVCPMELAVKNAADEHDAYNAIKAKLSELSGGKK